MQWITLTVVLVGTAGHALAQAPESTRDAEAQQLFRAGAMAYSDGRFDQALDRFRESYEMSARPELLYNIGQCLDRLRRDTEAIEVFEQYLRERPEAPNRREVEQRLDALRTAAGRARPEPDDAGAPEVDLTGATDVDATPVTQTWWFWTAVGVSVAAIVATVFFVASDTEPEDPVSGDFGPGGVVIALGGGP